jgi:hypothetical protein
VKSKRNQAIWFVLKTIDGDPKLKKLYNEFIVDTTVSEEVVRFIQYEARLLPEKMRCLASKHLEAAISYSLYSQFTHLRSLKETAQRTRKALIEKEVWQNKLLYYFSRFCGPANRENIQFMQRDFILEARDMRQAQHHKWFMATALTWRALFGGILPIMSDGLLRLIKPVKEAKKSGD